MRGQTRAAEEDWTVPELRRALADHGLTACRARHTRTKRVLRQLVTLRREDLSGEMLEELVRWWSHEIAPDAVLHTVAD